MKFELVYNIRKIAEYGHALSGVRVLKFDGAIAPKVLKFDSGSAAEGCGGRPYGRQYKCCLAAAGKTIQPPCGRGNAIPLLVAGATTLPGGKRVT